MKASFLLLVVGFCLLGAIPVSLLALDEGKMEQDEGVSELEKGLWIERKENGFLKLDIKKNKLRIHFFDQDKRLVKPDPVRVIAHFTPRNVTARQTVIFKSAEEGEYLEAQRFVRPPFNFNLILVLVLDEAGEQTESYAGRILPKHEMKGEK